MYFTAVVTLQIDMATTVYLEQQTVNLSTSGVSSLPGQEVPKEHKI